MKILAIRVGAVGDTVFLSPVLQNLHHIYPGSEIHLLGHPERGRLLLGRPNADHLISSEDPRWLDLHRNPPESPEAITWLSGHELVIGYSSRSEGTLEQNLRKALGERFIQHPAIPPEGYHRHCVEFLLEPLASLGHPIRVLPPVVSRFAEGEHSPLTDLENGSIVIHPGAGSPAKRWPLEHFVSLSRSLMKRSGAPCRFLLGPAETELEAEIIEQGEKVLPPLSLGQVASLLRSARGYAGNDSGITHLAAALGLPTVAVFTATDPAVWRPLGSRVRVFHTQTGHSPEDVLSTAVAFLTEDLR